jgi:hypothetical protein
MAAVRHGRPPGATGQEDHLIGQTVARAGIAFGDRICPRPELTDPATSIWPDTQGGLMAKQHEA